MKISTLSSRFLSLAALALISHGCASPDNASAKKTITYTGSTAPATITASNARELSVNSFSASEMGLGFQGLGEITGAGTVRGNVRGAAKFARAGARLARDVRVRAIQTINEALPSECNPPSGAASMTIRYDDASPNNVYASVVFTDFCSPDGAGGKDIFNGGMTVTVAAGAVTMDFDNFVITSGDQRGGIDGTLVLNESRDGAATVALDVVLQDGTTGRTYMLDNVTITSSDVSGGTNATFNGTFCEATEGCVTFTTTADFFTPSGAANPTAGALEIAGANGAKARLTALADGRYTVEFDNGNGVFVVVEESGRWDEAA